jgi:hypothetical protein
MYELPPHLSRCTVNVIVKLDYNVDLSVNPQFEFSGLW